MARAMNTKNNFVLIIKIILKKVAIYETAQISPDFK